jgi:hypothetical protein
VLGYGYGVLTFGYPIAQLGTAFRLVCTVRSKSLCNAG